MSLNRLPIFGDLAEAFPTSTSAGFAPGAAAQSNSDTDKHQTFPPGLPGGSDLNSNVLEFALRCVDSCHSQARFFHAESERKNAELVMSRQILDLEHQLKDEQNLRERLHEKLNIRGGLERIIYQGKLNGKIPLNCPGGAQGAIDELAKSEEFAEILGQELASRKLVDRDVLHCVRRAYHQYSKTAHGNDGLIYLDHSHHTANEIAALVILLRLQEEWDNPLAWIEVQLPRKTAA